MEATLREVRLIIFQRDGSHIAAEMADNPMSLAVILLNK
jgi:hypothetical protein